MEVVIVPDPEAAGVVVADAVSRLIERRPTAVLGLATGARRSPSTVSSPAASRTGA